jgi:hypothetical protein
MVFAPQLVGLFVDGVGAEKVISTGQEMLYIITPFYALLVFKGTVDNVMCGAGYMKGFIPGTFVDLGVRVVGAYVLAALSGSSTGIWWSWPMGWVFGCLIAGLFFFPPVGLIVGPFVGAFIGELMESHSKGKALKVALMSFVGFVLTTGMKIVYSGVLLFAICVKAIQLIF